MKRLDLAFVERPRLLGGMLLATGATLLGGALLARQYLVEERTRLLVEQTRVASVQPTPAPVRIAPNSQADETRLQHASAELGRDWEHLFAPIERAAVPELRLLSIDPDANAGNVVITTEAPTYEFAVEYTERLSAYGLRAVTLLSHAPTPDSNGRVRVKIYANWNAQ